MKLEQVLISVFALFIVAIALYSGYKELRRGNFFISREDQFSESMQALKMLIKAGIGCLLLFLAYKLLVGLL